MSHEFYVECYLQGTAGAVKVAELGCDSTEEARAALARNLVDMFRPEDAGKATLRLRRATAEDAAGVALGLSGALADAWRAACRGLLQ
jgi:hypothetical protein